METNFFLLVLMGAGILVGVRLLSRFFPVPEPLLFLIAGVAFGSTGVISAENELMQMFSMVAITLVMFHTGLGEGSMNEFFHHVIKNIRVAVVAAIGPWVGAFIATKFILGLTLQEGVVAGAVFTATALPFTLGLLRARGLMDTAAARSAIAAATTDDVLASLIGTFTAIALAATMGGGELSGEVMLGVLGKVGMVLLFFASIYLVSWLIDPKPHRNAWINFHKFTQLFYHNQITFPFIILVLAFIIFYGEMIFHVHYAISALMVGILFKKDLFYNAETDQADPHAPTFENFESTMVPLVHNVEPFFYIYLGLHLNLSIISGDALIAGVTIFGCVVTLQFISAYSSGRWVGLDHNNGMLLGMSMLPRDVLAFVVLSLNAAALPEGSILFVACIVAIALLNLTTTVGLTFYKYK
uniref:Putative Na+/H+ exchanger n=1 Tax=Magnetococcus massalia (strain MO-1) TaxID=451514 RepID=A0A1S7LKV5_MAGMO|nr:putative Na+/H+ exchanger [Candidatus Magnetococcus massalia]